ncbi:hypothetical protein VNO78_20057 [Psophocarpus tetragonolobus]|uniref:Uncharacterized protein n=1 Tax=Psophocarpus tetragonolobus TaxID=3891 RepID=A0AAN9SAL7_PSOTE
MGDACSSPQRWTAVQSGRPSHPGPIKQQAKKSLYSHNNDSCSSWKGSLMELGIVHVHLDNLRTQCKCASCMKFNAWASEVNAANKSEKVRIGSLVVQIERSSKGGSQLQKEEGVGVVTPPVPSACENDFLEDQSWAVALCNGSTLGVAEKAPSVGPPRNSSYDWLGNPSMVTLSINLAVEWNDVPIAQALAGVRLDVRCPQGEHGNAGEEANG